MKTDTKRSILRFGSLVIVVALAVWVAIPQHPSLKIGRFERDLNIKLGLDLQGGSHLTYRALIDREKIDDPEEALAGVRDVIERRVNAFGVSEPLVQTNTSGNDYKIIVELAGVTDPEEAKEQIGATPTLEFRQEMDPNADGNINIDDTTGNIQPFFEPTDLTGKHLERATVSFDQLSGAAQVVLNFDGEGSDMFAEITKNNIGKRIAIYLDGALVQAPVVQAEITNGTAVITGYTNVEEAKQVARNLNSGALPVPVELIGQQTIGPTLGRLSVQQSIRAGIVGIIGVIVWMIVWYRMPGVVAALALGVYAVVFFAIIKLIPVTLTLAGIAGFILSIGMAVDANVLIFERFRENLRNGKTVPYSLKNGFDEAWDAIKASNISSLITGVILYSFGTSLVRGFAVTFSIGIVLSMITAIAVTRTLLAGALQFQALHKPVFLGAKSTQSV